MDSPSSKRPMNMTNSKSSQSRPSSPRLVKAGTAFKKGSGGGFLIHRHNWKPRYLVLTLDALLYFDHQDGHLKGSVDLSDVYDTLALEIMPKDCHKTGHSAASEWRLRINTPSRQFVMAASCERDMREWVEALLSVFRANERRRSDTNRRQKATSSAASSQWTTNHPQVLCGMTMTF